ncbi:MAG: hypothetical protein OXU50_02005 [Gammaproteobacteria bacterium]|nr:hypothetical protein [Gammaproteobacteria bacterium]
MMNYRRTSIEKSEMVSANRLRLQAVCVLLLYLFCGVAGAQTGPGHPMTVFLSSLTDFPVSDPYCTTPPSRFLGAGPQSTELCTSVELPSIPVGVVDWILVELRETSGSSVESAGGDTVIARKPGLLLSSGRVVDATDYRNLDSAGRNSCLTESGTLSLEANDNCPDLLFEVTLNDNLYVVVRHRNHVDIISSVAVVATAGDRYVYDFSSSLSTVRRGIQKNFVGHLSRRRGVGFAMMASGDVNQDGSVLQRTDAAVIRGHFGRPRAYTEYDINMDGFVNQVDDLQDYILGNLGLFSPVPR